jgi:hypothetical protein
VFGPFSAVNVLSTLLNFVDFGASLAIFSLDDNFVSEPLAATLLDTLAFVNCSMSSAISFVNDALTFELLAGALSVLLAFTNVPLFSFALVASFFADSLLFETLVTAVSSSIPFVDLRLSVCFGDSTSETLVNVLSGVLASVDFGLFFAASFFNDDFSSVTWVAIVSFTPVVRNISFVLAFVKLLLSFSSVRSFFANGLPSFCPSVVVNSDALSCILQRFARLEDFSQATLLASTKARLLFEQSVTICSNTVTLLLLSGCWKEGDSDTRADFLVVGVSNNEAPGRRFVSSERDSGVLLLP